MLSEEQNRALTEVGPGTLMVGQAFDGTATPMIAGYFGVSLIGIVFVLIAEKGRLFRAQHAPLSKDASLSSFSDIGH